MECKRCGNQDKELFYQGSRGLYCRKCAAFKRILLQEEPAAVDYEVASQSGDYHFNYPLTSYQLAASAKTKEYLLAGKDVLLYCVTGAGKTEIVVESISAFLKDGAKVCYAIARKEVVIELEKRFRTIFANAEVVALYGGHHERLSGDLIVCTTHQLFRFHNTFDLLVIDEADAYPLDGNETLMNISIRSCKGNIVFSTATLSPFLCKVLKGRNYKEVSLLIRPSLKPMVVPKTLYLSRLFLEVALFLILKKMKGQCIVFVDRKKDALYFYSLYKNFFSCTYVYSDLEQRNEHIQGFKERKYRFIFSTTVLERGVTIKDVNVIVIYMKEQAFSQASIIQMVGRVGRSIDNPGGLALIITNTYAKAITKAIAAIKEANNYYEMSVLHQGDQ